jgi:pyruvate kinase
LAEKDRSDLEAALNAGIDWVALSFIQRPEDIAEAKKLTRGRAALMAKIEKPQAVHRLSEIMELADALMVARGDLGVEMPMEKVPFIQKSIIEKARRAGKFVITATQMMESMIENPFPTRAEVSDVANAIYDGTDAVMLSAETSVGKYPVETVKMMSRTAAQADESVRRHGFRELMNREYVTHAEIVADSAYRAARMSQATAIVVFSASGSSARLVSKFRPPVPIFVFTASERVARVLSIVYGVQAVVAKETASTDEMMLQMDRTMLERGYAKPRDSVVFVAGQPIGRPGTTNLMKLHRIGEGR